MSILLLFSFIGGIVTVLSPCVLPVLPLLLSGSIGGRLRPLGIIAGFSISFAALTLGLSYALGALGLDTEFLRILGGVIILIMGTVFLVPKLKTAFMLFTSRFVKPIQSGQPSKGFGGGFLTGISTGIMWTPCVGPILASVLTLSASGGSDGTAILIVSAYTLGTIIPMTAVMFGGRGVLKKNPVLSKYSAKIQQGFGFLMIAVSVLLFTGADRSFQIWVLKNFSAYERAIISVEERPEVYNALEDWERERE
jgi:cytochrome c-type biogenesis protein